MPLHRSYTPLLAFKFETVTLAIRPAASPVLNQKGRSFTPPFRLSFQFKTSALP